MVVVEVVALVKGGRDRGNDGDSKRGIGRLMTLLINAKRN